MKKRKEFFMLKSKSKLSLVIGLSAVLTILFALVFPAVCLKSQTYKASDYTYIFGFTSIFGGTIVPKGSNMICVLHFNVGAFLNLLFIFIGAALIVVFDKQISSYAFGIILFLTSLLLSVFNLRLINDTNGFISGFTPYVYTAFGTYVVIGFCALLIILCACNIYILRSERSRSHRRKSR